LFLLVSFIFSISCDKFEWYNPYDPECPKPLFTPSTPGAQMEGNSVKLTWSQDNDNISSFALFRRAEGESITNLATTQKTTTQYLDASIIPGKKYTYYVLAVAGENKSDTVKAEITPVIPITISTGSVTEIGATTAKIGGNITNAGGGTVTSRGICWSTTQNPTVSNSKTTEGTGPGQYTSILTGLLAGTTYYARAYGENSRGVVYGSEVSFTTLGPPKLTTTAVSSITETTATSGGTITSDGGSPITAKGVVWSTSPNPTISLATKTNDGTGLGAFTSAISNLTNNTKYYIRAYAINAMGTAYGEELSFTTAIPVPPILESLKQGLVAYYPFNGNANDSSGNKNNGVFSNGAYENSQFGMAAKFNGSNSIFSTPNIVALNTDTFTFSIKVKLASHLGHNEIQLGVPNGPLRWSIGWDPNTIYLVPMTCSGTYGQGESYPQTPVSTNTWYNLIYVNRGIYTDHYLDGKFVGTSKMITPLSCWNSNMKLYLGGDIGGGAIEYYNGLMDECKIWNRNLSDAEIKYISSN